MSALSTLPTITTYCTRGDLEAILAVDGIDLRVDDNQGGTVSATEETYVTAAINWATARVNIYLLGRYSATQLAQSYVCNDFTAIIAAHKLARRRGNPAPQSLQESYEESIEMLKQIKANELSLEDVPERTSGSISWRNIHHSRHMLRRNRVQRPISEQTSPQGAGAPTITPDVPADYYGPELYWL